MNKEIDFKKVKTCWYISIILLALIVLTFVLFLTFPSENLVVRAIIIAILALNGFKQLKDIITLTKILLMPIQGEGGN